MIMAAKKRKSDRKRSRPLEKRGKIAKAKSNKLFIGVIVVTIAVIVILAVFYLYTPGVGDGNGGETNTIPSASADYPVISKNSVINQIDILANDIDDDGDTLNITDLSIPSHGSVTLNGSYAEYTPSNNFTGVDSFEYTISDGKGGTTTAIVHVVVADENPVALINTSMGMIVVELYEDKVPTTTENFIKLANDGFYNGLVFHRVIDDFMIQGGGFTADGTPKESPYGTIDLEIHPDVRHVDGAIAMARTSDPNSATSQFFINDGSQPQLEPEGVDPYGYAAFGKTIVGMDVVRAIASVDTTTKYGMQNWPVNDVLINNITIENQ